MSGYYNRNNRGITKKLGPVTAYADAVLAGYKGTREQWAQDMAKLGQNVTQVAQNTELTTELAEKTRENTEQVAKDTADVRRLAGETSDNAVQVASNTAESNRLAKETKQAAAQAKADAEYAGAAADNFRVDTTLSEEGKAAEAKTAGEKFAQLSEEIAYTNEAIGFEKYNTVWDRNTHSLNDFETRVSSGFWGNDKLFPKGLVKHIDVKTVGGYDGENLEIVFLNAAGKCIYKTYSDNFVAGINTLSIDTVIHEDFHVLIRCNGKLAFASIDTGYKWVMHSGSIDIGNDVDIVFLEGSYTFGFVLEYESVTNTIAALPKQILRTNVTHNKVFVSGDSITATYPTYNDEIGWAYQVGKALGVEITRAANSGNGYVYSTGSGNAKSITADTNFANYDFTLYAWGTNDYGNNCEIGTLDDETPGREHIHLYGVLHYIIRKVLADNPMCTPILITPINRSDYGSIDSNWAYGTPNGLGYTLNDYCDAIVNIAKYYGIPYVDNRISPFTRVSVYNLLGDNLHPNEYGYRRYGQWLSAQLSQYIMPYFT